MNELNCRKCGQSFPANAEVNGTGPVCPQCAATVPPSAELTPELLAWVRGCCNEDEAHAGLDEVRAGGGKELSEFIHEIERGTGGE